MCRHLLLVLISTRKSQPKRHLPSRHLQSRPPPQSEIETARDIAGKRAARVIKRGEVGQRRLEVNPWGLYKSAIAKVKVIPSCYCSILLILFQYHCLWWLPPLPPPYCHRAPPPHGGGCCHELLNTHIWLCDLGCASMCVCGRVCVIMNMKY